MVRKTRTLLAVPLAALAVAPAAYATPKAPSAVPTAVGSGGAVSTVDPYATRTALDVLRSGGNAVDAAVAAAAVLGVVEPYSCGVGGGGFLVIHDARTGRQTTIDGRETAPGRFRSDSFINPATGEPYPFRERMTSGLGVGVPGTVRSWELALREYGTRSLGALVKPAEKLAQHGFVVDPTFTQQTQQNLARFRDFTSTRETFLTDSGDAPEPGTVFKNRDLADVYKQMRKGGAGVFYSGEIARAIVAAVQRPPTVAKPSSTIRPGLMEVEDLRAYRAIERAPTRSTYRGLEVVGMGPPSSGGSTIGEALNIMERFDLAGLSRADVFHYMLEAARLSFADRGGYLGDADFVDVPLRGLLSDGFAAERAGLIGDDAMAHPAAPGDPWPYNDGATGSAAKASKTGREGRSTTHLTVSDRFGNVVSYTFTIEATGGSGIVVPGHGFLLNNELTDFDPAPATHPNAPAPGKRPRSSMSPTIVLQDGKPVLALGSPGGSTIITTVLQVLVDRFDLGSSLPAAVAAPRVTQRNSPVTLVEEAFRGSPEERALAARKHRFDTTSDIGALTAIEFLRDGRVLAAAEPQRRGGGSAMVERSGD